MNSKLKMILQIAETVAVEMVPGAGIVDKVAHDVHDHKSVISSMPDLSKAVMQIITSIDRKHVADEEMFALGAEKITDGFTLLIKSTKTHET